MASRNHEVHLLSELNDWLDRVTLRGLSQMSMNDVTALEQMHTTASTLHMNTLVHLLDQQIDHIRRYLLHHGQREQVTAVFFRISAYLQMMESGD